MFFNLFTRKKPTNRNAGGTEHFSFSHMGQVLLVVINRKVGTKRLTLRVRDRKINLTTPPNITRRAVEKFIIQHYDWVQEQLEKDDIPGLAEGDEQAIPTIWYQGVVTEIRLVKKLEHQARSKVEHSLGSNTITITMAKDSRVRPSVVLEGWLKKKAALAIRTALNDVLPVLDEAPVPISVRDQKTRWGSCSTTRRLSFNWRLIMAPLASLHYVVVHEAVHLIHHNHSHHFWDKVEDVMPDYSVHQQWLKTHQQALFASIERRLANLTSQDEGQSGGQSG